jgi:Flp pilus assembly protein TadB
VSKERARRREQREREAALRAAARAEEQARRARREARKRVLTSRLPSKAGRPTGILADRRRKQTGVTIALLIAVNVLVWIFFGDWAARAGALVVSLLVAPVLHLMLFKP